jgi:hypothetical protein
MAQGLRSIDRVGSVLLTLLFFATGIGLYAFLASYVEDRGRLFPEFALTLMFGAVMYPAFRRLEPLRITLEGYFAFVVAIAAITASVAAADVPQRWQAGMFVAGLMVFVAGIFNERCRRRAPEASC